MHQKPSILIVSERLQIGGAEKYIVLVANELHARGYRVVILSNEGPFRAALHPDIRFVRTYFRRGLWLFLYGALQIAWLSITEKISVVHTQQIEPTKAAWIARFITRKPVLMTVHGFSRKQLLRMGEKVERYSDVVVTVVDWLVDELVKNGVAAHKLRLVYNGMDAPSRAYTHEESLALRASLGINAGDVVILSVSRLDPRKNHAEFFEWFPRILAEVPHAKYVIVGDGTEKEPLLQKIREHNLAHAIMLVDGTTNAEPYLHMADIFCTPSVAQGMAVLEAMAAGIPVVGTTPMTAPEVVRDGETGFTVSKHDGDAFVARLIELAQNPDLRRRFGAAGKKRQAELFSNAQMVDGLVAIYDEMAHAIQKHAEH